MKRTMMAALAAAGLFLAAAPAQAQRNGLYEVNGVSADGITYGGTMMMQQVGLASWRVIWQVGEARFEGYGMSAGPSFAIGFTVGERPGMAIFQRADDGSLTGQWTIVGSAGIGTETLIPRDRPAGQPGPATARDRPAAPVPAPAPAQAPAASANPDTPR
ncbi:hypothetical protein [Roseomonas indoligenes]|uniref:Uncharacterized protein n=1 Tax=Roseomonas indoligenes TaxID=2820811 RepID=A0A940MY31_9PROT|nr:hypothetical protein [Pararoseomonas indoligenes]MBP0493307.1 hypothetical protein [Pararoseomonas indoligenes]